MRNKKAWLLAALLAMGGLASAQSITIKGNVFGGGKLGSVKNKVSEGAIETVHNTAVTINGGTMEGSVYGGGEGSINDEMKGLVEGNTSVTMTNGTVKHSIYGGGDLGSVGTFTSFTPVTYADGTIVSVPNTCQQGTGLVKVLISGGEVGIRETMMPMVESGLDDDFGYVYAASRGEADSITHPKAIALSVVDSTYLEISGTALIHASVYGGSEDGLVLRNTHVKIMGGQIGTGYYMEGVTDHWDGLYTEQQWNAVKDTIKNGTLTDADCASFHECHHWPYQIPFAPFDPYNDTHTPGSDGSTYFGNVFGGGSGYYPIAANVWRRSAGQVNGNTTVEVTGGHILTNIYGGNELTDVLGKATVTMTGGTLGVPRTVADINAHPVTGYLFGAGKGDQRPMFDTRTKVGEVEVNIGGTAFFFGSVFGGGEDGHVLGDIVMNINNLDAGDNEAHFGTWGYSYVDGNVFGGGRGFSGSNFINGSVGGNIEVNIAGGTILGSIYGGGRLASVGIGLDGDLDNGHGYIQSDTETETFGHVTINITGGTIGNDYESKLHLGNPNLEGEHSYGGNVFGGSMGHLTKPDGTINPQWPLMGQVKTTNVNISGDNTVIKGNVYGGCEFGMVRDTTNVNINGGTIWRNVFGGGYGSANNTDTTTVATSVAGVTFRYTPMAFAGLVGRATNVTVSGGWVKKCVYGGGEMATVGLADFSVDASNHFNNITKHTDETSTFALSWPYEYAYFDGFNGSINVNITGGRIGLTGKDFMGPWNASGIPLIKLPGSSSYVEYDSSNEEHKEALKEAREDNGDVYGGGKGLAGNRYDMAFCANADNTKVTVTYPESNTATPSNYMPSVWVSAFYEKASDWTDYGNLGCIAGALYGGGENGHVKTKTDVTLNNGLVGHNIYGGGKGSDTYVTQLKQLDPVTQQPVLDEQGNPYYDAEITSITAGKVYGNTHVTMNGGYVVRNVFGGGNRASVGKGNYAGGPGDFTPAGYGERWPSEDSYLRETLASSGHTYVNIFGGTVGTVNGMKDDLPTGNVYGSSRGEPAPNVRQNLDLTPRIEYYPEFFLGYTNHTHVTIGEEEGTGNGPRLYGSVFGGGQDGHVRWDANVTVNAGEIGNKYDSVTIAQVGTDTLTDYQWRGRGCVFGGGAGLGKFTDATGSHYSTSAGSVTQFTEVTIKGGTIHQSVFGGGPLSSVGPPAMGQATVPSPEYSLAKVNIYSAIGDEDVVKETEPNSQSADGRYGGCVYGASRGVIDPTDPLLNFDRFSTTMFTEVNLYEGASVPGDVYGGGQLGQVKNDTKVNMLGGTVGTIDYAHKHNTASEAPLDSIFNRSGGRVYGGGAGYPRDREAALVKGNTEVNISGGLVLLNVYGGGETASVGLRDTIFDGDVIKDYAPKANTGLAKVNVTGGQVGPAPRVEEGYNIPIGLNGTDGYVFGGGKGNGDDPRESFKGFADVNYTSVTVNIPADADTTQNRVWGSIFGGAEDGHVLGSDTIHFVSGYVGTKGTTGYDGNIFGGGRNYSMKNYTAGRTRGNITVEMTGGQLFGSIFGGGRLALTGIDFNGKIIYDEEGEDGEKFGNVHVAVSGGKVGNEALIEDFTTYSMGDVFGGGKGAQTGIAGHPKASATLISMTKNTQVDISGTARIYGSVFGGGETANVGHYVWTNNNGVISDIQLLPGTGKTIVNVSGGTIGLDNMALNYDLLQLDENGNLKKNFDIGHVFGAGEGFVDNPNRLDEVGQPVYPDISINGTDVSLYDLMNTVGETEVTISNTAFVKGSVYGGGLNGHVERDATVKVQGGQIGFGEDANGTDLTPYDDEDFVNPLDGITDNDVLSTTPHWPNGDANGVIVPYDPVSILNGSYPADGGSWFGNVFGGGSGWYPYLVHSGNQLTSHWNRMAGRVKGNVRIEISGGHILNNVYGGCELTDLGVVDAQTGAVTADGKATIVMSGGTVGVPRTVTQINEMPTVGYIFGSGRGNPGTYFNIWTNVRETDVSLTGGTVYGSVFGGGEDGHVWGDAKVKVSKAADKTLVIGSYGSTGLEGNVYGGGQGVNPVAITAGGVGGNTQVDVEDGRILGSVYGGGRTGSVGVYFVDPNDDNYGNLQDGEAHGYTKVNITGGTIGHQDNTGRIGGNVYGGSQGLAGPQYAEMAKVKETEVNISEENAHTFIMGSVFGSGEDGHVLQNTHVKMSNGQIGGMEYNPANPTLCSDIYHGNVYGGGRGLNTYTDATGEHFSITAGKVDGNSTVEISGGRVCRNVYGGGNIASVGDPGEVPDESGSYATGLATVTIKGGIIGVDGRLNVPGDNYNPNGHVFGSGHGLAGTLYQDMAYVKNTEVKITENATVLGSVFGSGEDGHVRHNTHVLVDGGIIGTDGRTGIEGNVYGGGRGLDEDESGHLSSTAGKVGGNTTVDIVGGTVKGSVFGGGRLSSVGDPNETPDAQGYHTGLATVTIGGGSSVAKVGTETITSADQIGGNVYGGGKGQAGATYRELAFVKNTRVYVKNNANIRGSVFGGGEDGHVRQTSTVNVEGGVIGFAEAEDGSNTTRYHGNVYGAGRGIDNTEGSGSGYSWTAGRVNWSTTVNVSGGHIYRNVYGGGNLASVGRVLRNNDYEPILHDGDMIPLDQNDQPMLNADGSENGNFNPALLTGWAHVNITGGIIGSDDDTDDFHGNVFGSSHGRAGEAFKNLAYVHNAEVKVNMDDSDVTNNIIKGSVFGGGEDGHVTINTKVTVNGGQIGAKDNDELKGNVYGGGRGIDLDQSQNSPALSSTAGLVKGHTRVYVNGGTVKNSVYGGGNQSVVREEKVVNINGGTVEQDVFGGCNAVSNDRQHIGLKTVNVRDGLIKGNVYGCSHNSTDGNAEVTPTEANPSWTSFVNISGGEIGGNDGKGNVHGAGYEGEVKGSVCVNIGKDAIVKQVNNSNQPRIDANLYYNDCGGDEPGLASGQTAIEPSVGKLLVKGSVFGGSDYYTSNDEIDWNVNDITGFSNIYIDGTGYNTTSTTATDANYMAIQGGIYGSGSHCEGGTLGSHILLKDYGTRNSGDELTQATRTLTTLQRGDIVMLDHANVNLSGAEDISGRAYEGLGENEERKAYGVMKVDEGLYVTNASGLVLGATNAPVFIDSIKLVKSLHLMNDASSYDNMTVSGNANWEWIGVKEEQENAHLYYTTSAPNAAIGYAQENVIRFNDVSQLWVRYTTGTTNYFGELQGFFRMRSDVFGPRGRESFAYARPKITDADNTHENTVDGGFLSYQTEYNFFTDLGADFTKTNQHPYTNVLEMAKGDRIDYRLWVIPTMKMWYVDGRATGGIGVDDMTNGRGLYPDKPKLTISALQGVYSGAKTLMGSPVAFNQEEDGIYVVGHVNSKFETGLNGNRILNKNPETPLRLYRYPGGHPLSSASASDPGANYADMVLAESPTPAENENPAVEYPLTLNNVLVDGLYGVVEQTEIEAHQIPADFDASQVTEPLVVTKADAEITLNGGTVLQRGYNNIDAASTWYYNADYTPAENVHHGGALFVDENATVNVEGLVTITGNLQRKGEGTPINSNVYLPTFQKSLNITGALTATDDAKTEIGITSPNRNTAAWYYDNTFSPVAKATNPDWAASAWEHCDFIDDQGWFFVNGNKTSETPSPRTTYYNATGTKDRDNKTLYFGWTWANVVRTAPTGYSATSIDSPEDLAWLITDVPTGSMKQTADVDMKQYVWVPIGDEDTPFAGQFDGQGHLIKNLYIEYIGTGDLRYELNSYGLFGHVKNGTVDRTFLVSGKCQPVVSDLNGTAGKNIGGLVGCMAGSSTVSNSEAAVLILGPNLNDGVTGNAIGGLVAKLIGGEIHSSMAMSTLSVGQNYKGTLGGLVGNATGGIIHNAFANGTFDISSNNTEVVAGGLLGNNTGATATNCYANWYDASTSLTATNFGRLAASNTTADNMKQCYAMGNTSVDYPFAVSGGVDATCKLYSVVVSADMLGYMYQDNKIEGDTAMFVRLNEWVKNHSGHGYACWARPGLAEINGDLPVPLLCDLSSADVESTDDFRSLATYEKGKVLQYGGTTRDGSDKHLSTMLERDEYVFVYGDVDGHDETGFDGDDALATVTVEADKVSIYEHASIKYPGHLAGLMETYVGITFDNSFGHATSTPGVNIGLNGLGIGPYPLPRDWHMFSTPLNNAPQGFDYGDDNVPNGPSNNPWESPGSEFSWLTNPGSDECASGAGNRYWMKEFVATDQKTDGYFPTRRGSLFDGHVNDLFIVGSDECPSTDGHRYPYGMDFYTWNEPQYHWINFKRNGSNHWHSDEPHVQLEYVPVQGATANQNEDKLIVGRGYMAAITTGTFMQSHGILNEGVKNIPLTLTSSSKLKGWNLVGNPFHSYLDFDKVATGANLDVLSDENYFSGNADEGAFYVVYNADKYQNNDASTAFRYYPVRGSVGGDYAERYLHPHQGFYVRAKAEGNLSFNEGMLVPRSKVEGESTFRDDRPAYPLVNLYLSSDQGCADVTVIEFERPEWGGATKLKELRVGDGLFYAQHDNTHYAALFAQQGIDRVPVWFEAKEDDIFTMKWNTANADFHSMYLIDHITGIEYDMLRNDTYTFEGHKGDYPSRFLIVFSLTDVEEHNEIQTFVFFDGSQWIVTGDGQLDFVDPLGQVLMSKEVHGGQSRVGAPDVAPGVYLFRLTNSEGTRIQKVVVKR